MAKLDLAIKWIKDSIFYNGLDDNFSHGYVEALEDVLHEVEGIKKELSIIINSETMKELTTKTIEVSDKQLPLISGIKDKVFGDFVSVYIHDECSSCGRTGYVCTYRYGQSGFSDNCDVCGFSGVNLFDFGCSQQRKDFHEFHNIELED